MFHHLFSIIGSLGSVSVLLHTLHDGKVTKMTHSTLVCITSFLAHTMTITYLKGGWGKSKNSWLHWNENVLFFPFTIETGRGYLLGWAFFSGRISMRLSWSPRIILHIHVCKRECSTSECRMELCSSWNTTGFSLLFHIIRAYVEHNLFSRVFEIKGFLLSIKEGKNVLA